MIASNGRITLVNWAGDQRPSTGCLATIHQAQPAKLRI